MKLLGGPCAGAAAASVTALRNVAEHPRARHALGALLATLPDAQRVLNPASPLCASGRHASMCL